MRVGSTLKIINTHSNEYLEEMLDSHFIQNMSNNGPINKILHEIYEGFWKNRPLALFNSDTENAEHIDLYENANKQKNSETAWLDEYKYSIIVNNDKKEYINLNEYISLWERDTRYAIHPFPLLISINEEEEEIGGQVIEHPLKGHWANDRFVVVFEKLLVPSDFKNITEESLFYPYEDKYDQFQRNALKISRRIDTEVKERIARDLDDDASKEEVIENLKAAQSSYIKFEKSDGSIVERRGTLEENYSVDDELLRSKYLWFYDLDEGKAKRFIFENFISLTIDEI